MPPNAGVAAAVNDVAAGVAASVRRGKTRGVVNAVVAGVAAAVNDVVAGVAAGVRRGKTRW